MIVILLVDERCVSLRSYTERSSGDITSENAGMSSENYVRIIMVENLRFLEEGSSAQGKSTPAILAILFYTSIKRYHQKIFIVLY